MSVPFIAIFIAVALFAAAALVIIAIGGYQSAAQARLAQMTAGPASEDHYDFREILSYISRPLQPLRALLRVKGDEDLVYRLSVAGYRQPEDVDTFLNAKLLCPVLGVLLATFIGRDNALIFGLLFTALGFFAPDLYLMRATSRRKSAIASSLPDALDLLVICMEAGLGMDQAILRVASEQKLAAPELSDELLILCHEQRAGKPRLDAWRSMADRVDLDTVRQFTGMLAQSERLGTPIATALSQFADALRTKRLAQAEERAAKTSIKLLFPLILFIFPDMFIVILGPAVISVMNAFDSMSR